MKLEENKIVVCKSNYDSEQEMFNAIGDIIKHLTRNNEECLVYADDVGIGVYVIEHVHDNSKTEDWGTDRFMLVTSEEEDEILAKRDEQEEEE